MTVEEAGKMVLDCILDGGTVFACGNGGSMADAMHFVGELIGAFRNRDRCALKAIALGTNPVSLTAVANDYGFDQSFSRELDGLVHEDDVLLAISTSGKSKNVSQAALVARSVGCKVIALTGNSGQHEQLGAVAHHVLAAPSDDTPEIQAWHGAVLHDIAGYVEARAFVESDIEDIGPVVGIA